MEQDKRKRRTRMPSAPIKAPTANVKGIGKMGQQIGGLKPTVIDPSKGSNSPAGLAGQILGIQGKN